MQVKHQNRLSVDGKFFQLNGKRVWLKCITYGPFPDPQPDVFQDFERIAATGFHAVRLYTPPSESVLAAALKYDLLLFVGVPWQWNRIFLGDGGEKYWHEGRLAFLEELKRWGSHLAIAAVYVANEIPPDVARWMGYVETRKALDALIKDLREVYPHLLFAYANYPSSAYLEPSSADFTALNIYLEDKDKLRDYLAHAHHMAGDRPLLVSEFGMDSLRNGEERQSEVIGWQLPVMRAAGCAGGTLFSWSDSWQNGHLEVMDWNFGLLRRDGSAKPSMDIAAREYNLPRLSRYPMISVIICVHNGAERVRPCLEMIHTLNYPVYEVLVIDDGSSDGLEGVADRYSFVRYVRQKHSGLSAARNLGASMARGDIFAYTDDDCVPDVDWLYWLAKAYDDLECDLCGGPNLAPLPLDEDEAIVAAAPGAPSHVMLSDKEAEHLPGCNLSVKREAFELIGGFNERYWVAGDDVDFCWKAEKCGLKMGFHGAAFVWHRRRASFFRYFKQQRGYGKAEAMLLEDHPDRFNNHGDAIWLGVVYQGGAVSMRRDDYVYCGPKGDAAYQHIVSRVMPIRPLSRHFATRNAVRKLKLAKRLHPLVRAISRISYGSSGNKLGKYWQALRRHLFVFQRNLEESSPFSFVSIETLDHLAKDKFIEKQLADGWQTLENDAEWDLFHPQYGCVLICQENLGGGTWRLLVRSQY